MSVRMVLLGPPEAGKGAQAARIAERPSVPTTSTGDIFHASVVDVTELDTQAKAYMDKGEYVSDSVTNVMVTGCIAQANCENGPLLGDYPHITVQVGEFDPILRASDLALDVVVKITADAEAVVARLPKRAGEQGCTDDTKPVTRHRLKVHAESMAPLTGFCAERDLLVRVDGVGEVDIVTGRIMEVLTSRGIAGSWSPRLPTGRLFIRTTRLRILRHPYP